MNYLEAQNHVIYCLRGEQHIHTYPHESCFKKNQARSSLYANTTSLLLLQSLDMNSLSD